MGSGLSRESLTVDQFNLYLENLKTRDVSVKVIVTAYHYENYTVTETENQTVATRDEEGKTIETSVPVRHQKEKSRKVETCKEEHSLPLKLSSDLTGPILIPTLTKEYPILNVKIDLDVFPLDANSSEILEQFKLRLAHQFQRRDTIVDTEIKYSVEGHKTLEAGETMRLQVYNPEYEEEANAGCCCFDRPSQKNIKLRIIKKFTAAPLHYDRDQAMPHVAPQVHYNGAAPPQFQYNGAAPPQFQYNGAAPPQFQYNGAPPPQFPYNGGAPRQVPHIGTQPPSAPMY